MGLLQIETQAALKAAHRQWIETALKKSKLVRESKWTQSIAVGDKPFLKQIKEHLGIRAKGRKIRESGDGYQLSERQALYGDWHNADTENRFGWNLAI
jgi:putative transposase